MKARPGLAARAYYRLCLTVGRLLRSAHYSRVRIIRSGHERHVQKRRRVYAPLLVWLGGALFRILDAGVRVLARREWVERERDIHVRLRGALIRTDADGTLILPHLAGQTLAMLLEDAALDASRTARAIELAVAALAEFHRRGLTHGDAMAENVMVDLDAGAAHWFDFETTHDSGRAMVWRRADDVRALLTTCAARTVSSEIAATVERIIEVYGDEVVARLLAAHFATVWHRPLAFHLGQAGLSLQQYRAIGVALSRRVDQAWMPRVRTSGAP